MKTTKKDFEKFKKAFNEYVEAYGISGWQIIFRHTDLDAAYACISTDIEGRHSIVTLGKSWPDSEKDAWLSLELTARHEVIHLLLAEMTELARRRHVGASQLDLEEERLVRILEELLP